MIKNPSVITLKLWPHAVHYDADILSDTPNASGFTPKEIFTSVKGDFSFKNVYTFGLPTFALDLTIQKGNKPTNMEPRSTHSVLMGKHREHASNVSLT